jgi:hypothetical protein
VPGIAIIPVVIEAIRRATKKPLDVHLTMVEPDACWTSSRPAPRCPARATTRGAIPRLRVQERPGAG